MGVVPYWLDDTMMVAVVMMRQITCTHLICAKHCAFKRGDTSVHRYCRTLLPTLSDAKKIN
jgi:hypothetical protein